MSDNKTLQGSRLAGGNPTRNRAENDFYATPPKATRVLLRVEEIIYPALEPACGQGHISKLLNGNVYSSDLVYRGFGRGNIDFLETDWESFATVITNPPFRLFQEFAEKALEVASKKVILFGKIQALEGQRRVAFLKQSPLRTVYIFSNRIATWYNGSPTDENGKPWASTMCFAWYVWEKGYEGKPRIEWLQT